MDLVSKCRSSRDRREGLSYRIWLVFACIAALQAAAEPPETSSVLPLSKGTYCVYRGPVKWIVPDTQPPVLKEEIVTWKMEVLESIARGYVSAALVRGYPEDVYTYAPGRHPGEYVIVRLGDRRFYLIRGSRAGEVLKKLRNEKDELFDLVKDGEIFLEYPLAQGDRVCETRVIANLRGGWCWVVESKGTTPGKGDEYVLKWGGNTGNTFLKFAPGVGITGFSFRHFTTGTEADLRLVEFHRGE